VPVREQRRLVPKGLEVERLVASTEGGRVSVRTRTIAARVRCPECGAPSSRVHSRYTRTVADLPWRGIAVTTLEVRTRRFFCDREGCERRIFCERLEEVAARARKTARLEEALLAIAFELGGEAGARLARELGLLVSPDTLLRRIENTPRPEAGKVRILGVDDFALRRGHCYGTILVDLERRRVVDLLPERTAERLEKWLKAHPNIEVVSRDRYQPYIDGIRVGAPEALQVADRWHLLQRVAMVLNRVARWTHEGIHSATKR
jgi:transposase